MKLSPIQEQIVNRKGNLIVRASAGTGKTHTMVTKIAKELDENTSHKVIAAITFTTKAAQEIKDRLSVDITQQFIGTNNSFVIEEIINPFMKDVYGSEYNVDIDTDYTDANKFNNFDEGLSKIKDFKILGSYKDKQKNFVFKLAKKIVENSDCCRLYLKAKYFKIYIDEYQDCDEDMHNLFMYICDELKIDTFVVGDEKQAIYTFRGAYPKAFKSICDKDNFSTIFMGDNFRSCQQIQNYTNLLFEETRDLYSKVDDLNSIVMIYNANNIWGKILDNLDPNKKTALLRFSNDNAKAGAEKLSINDMIYVFIPTIPIADITTKSARLYMSIARFCIIDNYSVYNFDLEIHAESDKSKKSIKKMEQHLDDIKRTTIESNKLEFDNAVEKLAIYLDLDVTKKHLKKLYTTITEIDNHVSFEADKHKHVAITFHSSKGLEFDQVILFAEDYRLINKKDKTDKTGIYNHYVASTRAKEKLIIVYDDLYKSKQFIDDLKSIIKVDILNLITFK